MRAPSAIAVSLFVACVTLSARADPPGACVEDLRLVATARLAAEDPQGFTAASLRASAWRGGVRAPSVQALVLDGGDETSRAAAVARWLATRGATPELSRCASANTSAGVHAIALVPRVVEVRDERVDAGAQVWHVTRAPTARSMELVATGAGGAVLRCPVEPDGRASLRLGDTAGWRFQVLAEFETGPAPVAAWGGEREAAGTAIWSARALFAAINELRDEAGVAALRRDPTLDRVAAGHARTLAARAEVSHAPSADDTPWARMRAAGLTTSRVAENVARAATLGDAHANLAASPAHRANLLDGAVDAVGIGTARAGADLYVVELFAARPAWSAAAIRPSPAP